MSPSSRALSSRTVTFMAGRGCPSCSAVSSVPSSAAAAASCSVRARQRARRARRASRSDDIGRSPSKLPGRATTRNRWSN
eukprot:6481564-Prymnesium_polylepis.1